MSQQVMEVIVPENKEKERLDKFLVESIADLSRSKARQLIELEKVFVNGSPAKPSHLIHRGEKIAITIPPAQKLEVAPENIPLDIAYEDPYLLIVNKPAGMVVHPAYANYTGTLVNALLHYCQKLSSLGGTDRPGLVHRLDKDTSGLLVIAKDDKTHAALSQQFSKHQIDRQYLAIVWGHLKNRAGRIEGNIMRNPHDRTRMMLHPDGKYAATNYEVVEELRLTSYLHLRLETGRTHQIRVHLSSIGHPVLGDPTYGGRNSQLSGLNHDDTQFAVEVLKQVNHQILHAYVLGFTHPTTQEFLRFESPLPAMFSNLLEILRRGSVELPHTNSA